MSATAAPMGLLPVYHPSGQIRAMTFQIASGYATAIYCGDPVILNTNGTVTIGTAAAALLGVFDGVEYIDSTGKPNYSNFWPASQTVQTGTLVTAYVYVDPEIVYEIQSSGTVPLTAVGDEADVIMSAGNTSTGLSTVALNTVLAGAAAQKQFRIIGFGLAPDNAIGDAFTVVRVTLAQSQLRAATTAV
jgi:hypothetical protein